MLRIPLIGKLRFLTPANQCASLKNRRAKLERSKKLRFLLELDSIKDLTETQPRFNLTSQTIR